MTRAILTPATHIQPDVLASAVDKEYRALYLAFKENLLREVVEAS